MTNKKVFGSPATPATPLTKEIVNHLEDLLRSGLPYVSAEIIADLRIIDRAWLGQWVTRMIDFIDKGAISGGQSVGGYILDRGVREMLEECRILLSDCSSELGKHEGWSHILANRADALIREIEAIQRVEAISAQPVVLQACGKCMNSLGAVWNEQSHLWEVACRTCWRIYALIPDGSIQFVRAPASSVEAILAISAQPPK